MPLTGTGNLLGDTIATAIDAAVASHPTANAAQRQAIWRAIGTAIVAHLVANTTVVVTSVGAVTPGAGVSGPGAGTIT